MTYTPGYIEWRVSNACTPAYPGGSSVHDTRQSTIENFSIHNVVLNQNWDMHYWDRISVNPKVMMGKPVIKGTRVTVEAILEELAAGKTKEDLMDAFPGLDEEAILAALAFAADTLKGEKVY